MKLVNVACKVLGLLALEVVLVYCCLWDQRTHIFTNTALTELTIMILLCVCFLSVTV